MVNLKSDQDMKIDSINSADGTGTVKIDAAGSITDTNGEDGTGATPAIAAGEVDLKAGGTVGTADNALDTSADTVNINANGSVTAANDKDVTANITSQTGDVTLTADGDVNAQNIAAPNGDVALTADGDVTVTSITAKNDTTIMANGNVTGNRMHPARTSPPTT